MSDVHYGYRCEDRSLILAWLREPVFMPLVRAIPASLSPNQLTVAGHVAMWAGAAPALVLARPGAIALASLGIGALLFNLADTLDGMYARHSGRTSPLGELLDHGLDPVSLGLAALAFGLAMDLPPWLTLASTAAAGWLQFVTYLHGYRIGHVVLAEIGIVEALLLLTVVSLAAALGAREALATPVWAGISAAGLLAVGLVAATLPALLSMRALVRHAGDVTPLLVADALIAAWYARTDLSPLAAGLAIVAVSACYSMLVTSARLRRVPFARWEWPIIAMLAAALVVPGLPAFAVTIYAAARTAWLFSAAAGSRSGS